MWTVKTIADSMGLTVQSIYNYIRQGRIQTFWIGTTMLIEDDEAVRFKEEHRAWKNKKGWLTARAYAKKYHMNETELMYARQHDMVDARRIGRKWYIKDKNKE